MALVPTDPQEAFKRAQWEDHVKWMQSEDDAWQARMERDEMSEEDFSMGEPVLFNGNPGNIEISGDWVKGSGWDIPKGNDKAENNAVYARGYNAGLAAGTRAGRQQQREIDAAVCDERAGKHEPTSCDVCGGTGDDLEDSSRNCYQCQGSGLQRVSTFSAEATAYAAGYAAGQAAQRAADAAICQQLGDEWEAEEDLKAELYACRDAIRAANLPAPQSDTDQ